MTFLDDPTDDRYDDEAAARLEFSRVAGACHACRRCVDRCDVFPALFEVLDGVDDHDAERMTPEEQDRVADACFHCAECLVGCTDDSTAEDAALDGPIDVPRAMLRLEAVRHASRRRPRRDRVATSVLARPGLDRALVGTSAPGTVRRRLIAAATGRSAWSPVLGRPSPAPRPQPATTSGAAVAIVTGCTHGAFDARAVADAVALYGRLGVDCEVVSIGSCGAAALQAGEAERVRRIAERNTARLAGAGADSSAGPLVVLDPTCRWMIADEYARHLSGDRGDEAAVVAARTIDLVAHVAPLLDGRATSFPASVVVHSDVRMSTSGETEALRRLLAGSGTEVEMVEGSSGAGTVCGQRAVKDVAVGEVAARLTAHVLASVSPGTIVVSSCGGSGAMLRERTGSVVLHPATLLAEALVDGTPSSARR